ncbi:acyltransferase family protein [Pulveribacter suum]|uniref:acyltransferase family protein n=1 Tax=Pulveribacter suum TaxID=2116657 RepID=UPI0022205F7F|nr:acyltransferase [Pulveribacter suum]
MAALAVIFSHHFPITGTEPPSWLHSNMVGGVAVMTFFTISGYLVMLSWQREPHLRVFAGKRLLRLWPGMLVAVLADMLLFGPVFTSLPLRDFLTHPDSLEHWRNLLLVKAYVNMPGVFAGNPLAGLMNGPLWTIPMELLCYGALAAAGVAGILRSRPMATAVGLTYIGFFLVWRNADLTGTMRHWFEYPAYFVYGSLIALYRDAFIAHARRLLALLAPVAAILFFALQLEHTAGLLLLPPVLIHAGLQRGRLFERLHRLGDPSYGIYLLGCPIQQAVQATWPQLGFAPGMLLAMGLATLAGYASWHVVEGPALRLKRFLSQPPHRDAVELQRPGA